MPRKLLVWTMAVGVSALAQAAPPPGPGQQPTSRPATLTVCSGGHVKAVIEQVIPAFEAQTGAQVTYRPGHSGRMFAGADEGRPADLCIAADLRHLRDAERNDLVAAKVPVAVLHLAVVVAKGNPKNIRGLKDLARPGVRTYVESPTGCQVGNATRRLLAGSRVRVTSPAVTMDGQAPSLSTVAAFIKAGLLDAAVVWDSTAGRLSGQLDTVAIAPARNVSVNVVGVVPRSAPDPGLAEAFVLLLRGPRGRAAWKRHGFQTPPGARTKATGKGPAHSAERMIRASEDTLAPVYGPLAEQIVADLHLGRTEGVGIDLGSGPGTLIVELCKRTGLHWINADINPHFFAYFLDLAASHGVAHRVSAVYADAQALCFRDGYADVIVSRGSYHFWPDRKKGFAEVYRVLKPGGVAYIGRGFPANLPVATARAIRARQGKAMEYDPQTEAASLRRMMEALGIRRFRIHVPKPPGGEAVNYGLWIEFRKPADQES